MSESVIASIDTGADIGATATDTGASGESGAGAGEGAVSTASGAGAEGQRAAAEGAAAVASGADAKSASGSDAQGDGKDKLVSLAALQESREIVKALKAEIATLAAQPKLSAEDAELLKELRAQKKDIEAPKDPDFLEDPKGYVDAKLTKAQEALKKLDEANGQRTEQERQHQEFQQVMGAVGAKEAEFLKATPDYNDALMHIRTVRASQLALMYQEATPAQIQQQIGIEEVQSARQILQKGGDPADFAYKYAKTLGYSPKALAVTPPAVKETKVDKEAARSLGGGGGADSTGDEDENAMPEFAAAITERFNRGKRK